MNFKSPNLDIYSSPDFGIHVLFFKFKGKFTELASQTGARAWSEEMESSNNNYTFIWDCTDMSGFEPSARSEWYKSIKLYKPRISHVTIIASNILIRGAARVMMELFGIPAKIVRHIEEVKVEQAR